MAIASVLTDTFKEELLGGYHSFNASGDTPAGSAFKIALYSSGSANLGTTTTQWVVASTPTADPTNTYEVTTTASGYSSGGKALTNTGVAKSTVTSYTDFSSDDIVINATELKELLNDNVNVTLQANTDITVNSALTVTGSGSLNLHAGRDVDIPFG